MCSVGSSLFNCVSVGWWSHGFMCSVGSSLFNCVSVAGGVMVSCVV